jgi:hypothetical protein
MVEGMEEEAVVEEAVVEEAVVEATVEVVIKVVKDNNQMLQDAMKRLI